MTKVDLALLLREQREGKALYDPAPGTVYEIASGVTVKLKAPSLGLQDKYFEAAEAQEEEQAQEDRSTSEIHRRSVARAREIAVVITEGKWPESNDELYGNVVQRISMDFLSASKVIERPETQSLDQLSPLIERVLSRLHGSTGGTPATTDAGSS